MAAEFKEIEMTGHTPESSARIYAKVAGLAYVIIIMLGIFSVNYVESSLVEPENIAATVNNISTNEWLFRIGVASEVLMYALVVLLSLALYVILKPVNRNLALLALLWRLGEAIIGGATTVLSGIIPLLLIKRGAAFEPEQVKILAGLFLAVRGAGLDVVLIFIGMGGTLFCYLFFRSKFVPRILAAWGILTYLTMLILAFVSILNPDISETVKLAFYAPGGLFELIFGLWLFFKGIQVQ